jgi:hypothetical protein
MNINIFKNIGKYFTHQPPCSGRVASSAKMLGIKGSEAQRTQLAGELNDKFFKIIDDEFVRKAANKEKAELSKKELVGCIKQVVPNVKINVKYINDPMSFGYLEKTINKGKNTVDGFVLGLEGAVKKGEDHVVLRHEMRHFFDYMTQPKLAARSNTAAIIAKLGKGSESSVSSHLDVYSDLLYQPKTFEDNQAEISVLAKKLNGYFKSMRTPAEEKIEILQKWRSGLKTELNAYNDEAKFACKDSPDKYWKENAADYLFKDKIKLVEQALKDAISAVRKESALKFGPKASN